MIGVISENRQVIATTAGEPTPLPFGKVGSGSVAGSAQLIAAASAAIRRSYSAWARRVAGRGPGGRVDRREVGGLTDRVG